MTDAPVFLPRPTYRLFSAGGAAVALLFAWELLNAFSLPVLFFLLAAAGFAVVYLRWALMRLELTAAGVTVHAPLQAPLHILFRQMITCDEAGRIMPGLSLVYWPVSCRRFRRYGRAPHPVSARGGAPGEAAGHPARSDIRLT